MLDLQDVSLCFGEKTVFSGCSLHAEPGAHIALMGPSGCGKTTLLRLVLSLEQPDSGHVLVSSHRTAAVFQEPRLLPWYTAAENVNLVLSDRPETMPEARRWLASVELSEAADLYPSELSGGMQQRVSLARALAFKPELIILDEPLKGFDDELKERMLRLLGSELSGITLLLATHSIEDAEALGCQIFRYRNGCFKP